MNSKLSKIKERYRQIPFLVWSLLLANIIFNTFRFMSMPFMAIYFSEKLNLTPAEVGVLIGISPLSSLVFSVLGGRIADKFGIHKVYPIALLIPAASLIGYIVFENYLVIALFSVLAGIGWTVYNSTSNSILALHTPKAHTEVVFGYNYWVINLGGVLGPLLGVLVIEMGSYETPIILFSIILVVLAGSMIGLFRIKKADISIHYVEAEKELAGSRSIFTLLTKDRVLIWLMLSYFFIFFIEAQVDTNIAQYLNGSFEDGVRLFGLLVAMMTGLIVVLQPIVTHVFSRFSNVCSFIFGNSLYFLGFLILLFLNNFTYAWFVSFAFITIGEMIVAPKMQAIMAKSAPTNLKATYFSLIGAGGNFAYAIGPGIGGLLLTNLNINYLFLFLLFIVFAQFFALVQANKSYNLKIPESLHPSTINGKEKS
ncbi:hypothetical protein Plano_2673 [Planococcus sp. PAMC 21323]|uniref:MFS transporter n=1 Tax=Planococcus sp. PAMC 21323 TaxID=1526927 RepID=UPI000571C847|nr:MFS transporter [Planococcus sp. PAMC 21323]AIY06638.1 hypothetical protein Plano_2673 [Planococcus sp. PAMC 21323]